MSLGGKRYASRLKGTGVSVSDKGKEKSTLMQEKDDVGKRVHSVMKSECDEEIFKILLEMYTANVDKFDRLHQALTAVCLHTAPLFGFANSRLADVESIEEANMEDFKAKYIDHRKRDAKELGNITSATVRGIQYARWRWAQDNMDTYINQLRLSGFGDKAIHDMLDGVPLCFESPAHYKEFSGACAKLCRDLEEEQNSLVHARVVVTGSSVPGFSQNPFKGKRDRPSRMTSVAKSDVDICIVADGASDWISRLNDQNISFSVYPCTAGPHVSTNRYGLKPAVFKETSQVLFEFHEIWSEKLKGGFQITLQDAGSNMVPWEILIPGTQRKTVTLDGKDTPVQVDECLVCRDLDTIEHTTQ